MRLWQNLDDVQRFWLDEPPPVKWVVQDYVFDETVQARGLAFFEQATDSKRASWRKTTEEQAAFLREPASSF